MSPGRTRTKVARPERLELPTLWFEARCSIQLSYGRVRAIITTLWREFVAGLRVERKARVLGPA